MAYNKSLELAKIRPTQSYLGDYQLVGKQWFRAFDIGATIYSKDGISKYMLDKNGSFRKI